MTKDAPVYVQFVALCVKLTVHLLDHFGISNRILFSVGLFHKVLSVAKDGVAVVPTNGHPVMAALLLRYIPNALRVVLPSREWNFGRYQITILHGFLYRRFSWC